MTKDPADGVRAQYSSDETHSPRPARVLQYVDLETAAHELGLWIEDLRRGVQVNVARAPMRCRHDDLNIDTMLQRMNTNFASYIEAEKKNC